MSDNLSRNPDESNNPTPCAIEPFNSYVQTVPALLESIGAPEVLARQTRILIKPNLINTSPPPVTLPVEATAALVHACQQWSDAEIIVAEGVGEPHLTTDEAFDVLGYRDLAIATGIKLIDLNEAELVELKDQSNSFFPTFMMPKIIMDSFVISAAVLKAHSLATVTLSMKNMIGVAPPSHYQTGGHWKKALFHSQMQTSTFELNRYKKPDLAFIDASIGLADYHLGGPTCNPPVDKLIAGFDPVAVDALGSELLGIPWQQVGHITMADGDLGCAADGAGLL